MRPGKITQTIWRRSVLKQLQMEKETPLLKISEAEMCTALPAEDGNRVVLTADGMSFGNAPSTGYDAAVKAIQDLMTRGGEPSALQVRICLPSSAEERDVQALVREIKEVCEGQNISLPGIRIEVVPAVLQIMVQVTAEGLAEKQQILHLEHVAPGQDIILCGSLALEGMGRILDECGEELEERFVPSFIRQMKSLKKEMIQTEAIRAAHPYVSAMQQIGSGGILAALWEVAEASGTGLKADLSRMTVCQEAIEVCEFYRLNPYQMTSAGGILMYTDHGEALTGLLREHGARAAKIGVTTAEHARMITSGEEIRFLDRPSPDELAVWQEQRIRQAGKSVEFQEGEKVWGRSRN